MEVSKTPEFSPLHFMYIMMMMYGLRLKVTWEGTSFSHCLVSVLNWRFLIYLMSLLFCQLYNKLYFTIIKKVQLIIH